MTDLIPLQSIPGDQVCVSVKEFGEAMGAAQGAIIQSAGTAMIECLIIGMLTGILMASIFWYAKGKMDAVEVS